jgi:hypothetical protein
LQLAVIRKVVLTGPQMLARSDDIGLRMNGGSRRKSPPIRSPRPITTTRPSTISRIGPAVAPERWRGGPTKSCAARDYQHG